MVEMPKSESFEIALTKQMGKVVAGEIIQIAGERYGELYTTRERYSNKALRKHLEDQILPGVALYQALKDDGGTSERAMELLEVVFRDWALSMRSKMERMGRLPLFYGLLRALIKPVTKSNFPDGGWETEWVEISASELSFNMHQCFYKDVLDGYEVPEITRLYCWMDDLIYEDVSPYMKWSRTKTLGRGDDCCDFKFERVRGG